MAVLTPYNADLATACIRMEVPPADDPSPATTPRETTPTATQATVIWQGVATRLYMDLKGIGITVDTSTTNDARNLVAFIECLLTCYEVTITSKGQSTSKVSEKTLEWKRDADDMWAKILASPSTLAELDGATYDSASFSMAADYNFDDDSDTAPEQDPDRLFTLETQA